jgi:hypothetical protein
MFHWMPNCLPHEPHTLAIKDFNLMKMAPVNPDYHAHLRQ